ncbi:MAG: PEP-CTERM sorting domain-containing protein [Rhodospirillales bacterium]|nr:PEP-CTERM sorting domain-containing protein [Rhodospirillales bacterium]
MTAPVRAGRYDGFRTRSFLIRSVLLLAVAGLGLSRGITPAQASPIYTTTLGQSGSSGQGTGPWGTVSMSSEANGTTVDVTVSLLEAATGFVSTGKHAAFSFSIPGTIAIENLTSGFSIGPTNHANPPAGTFLYSIICTVCGRGGSNPYTGDLTFSVASASAINPLSFTANRSGNLFAADILANGATGVVYTDTPMTTTTTTTTGTDSAPVPEPSGMATLVLGLAMLAWQRRRRRLSAPHG